jgi:GxxExxY protein
MALIYEEITGKILMACFEVSNELGTGILESVYQNALIIVLHGKQVSCKTQYPISVTFRS